MARAQRLPQINFQVSEHMKLLYQEARADGNWVTRWCAAGFLAMVEDSTLRRRAITRLREWESEFADARPAEIRAFVQAAEAAMSAAAPKSRRARPAPKRRKKAKRTGSA